MIDVGKTNVKLALVDLGTLTEIAVVTMPNTVRPGPPWPHFDSDAHWDFVLGGLAAFQRDHGVDAISVTTHGASVVLLDAAGDRAAPILDYEHPIPPETAARYAALRPEFAQTGSPRLTRGLNVGAQLHWMFEADPGLADRTAHVIGYPQYWSHRLTGVVSTDVTSIGCHTDLWLPHAGRLSPLARALGIDRKIPPVRRPGDVLGPVLPDIAAATGLARDVPVICGIHDSNASLYPHLLMQKGPFSVVSTGTWVVSMSIGGSADALDPARDTLVNVNALGDPVPSARFMGGREFDLIMAGHDGAFGLADMAQVLTQGTMLLPSVVPGSGPYPGCQMVWTGDEPGFGTAARAVALGFYLALMTAACLRLTGGAGPVIVEGPFARNDAYIFMLAAATGRRVAPSRSATGTSIGAALLFGGQAALAAPQPIAPSPLAAQMAGYAAAWRARVGD